MRKQLLDCDLKGLDEFNIRDRKNPYRRKSAAETLQPLWKRMGCQRAHHSEYMSEDTGPEGHVKELEHPSKPREVIEIF